MRAGVVGVAPPPYRALGCYTRVPDASLEPLGRGLINETWLFETGETRGVLQRLNPIFPPRINRDIDVVTDHLGACGMATPRILRTTEGDLWVDLGADGVWRALSYIPGETLEHAHDPATLTEAGALLGRFHRCLATLDHRFSFRRPAVHDTDAHLRRLGELFGQRRGGSLHAEVGPLAGDILEAADDLPGLPDSPDRVLHGDPKLNNVRFDHGGRALCMLDLDTLRRGPLAHDLGDAWRSWCNHAGEDDPAADLQLSFLEAAVLGYAAEARDLLDPGEAGGFAIATERISLELASRFCVDAYEDRYFGWDADRFPTRRAHNLVRAQGQLSLWRAIAERRDDIRDIVQTAFA